MSEVLKEGIPFGIFSNIGSTYLFTVRLQIKKALKKWHLTQLLSYGAATQHVEIST